MNRHLEPAPTSVPVTAISRQPAQFVIRAFDCEGFPILSQTANTLTHAAGLYLAARKFRSACHVTLSIRAKGSKRGHLVLSERVR